MTFYDKAQFFFKDQKLDVDFFCDLKWASTYSEHRIKLRKQIFKQTKNKSVLDLKEKPSLVDQEISISHCPKIGGFVLSKVKVGLDLEQFQRLSPNLIQRISSREELNIVGEERFQILWTIKEAVFKSSSGLVKVVSDVQVSKNKELPISFKQDVEDGSSTKLEVLCFLTEAQVQDSKVLVYSMISKPDDICLSLAYPA